jgi:GT2 family glycosyltransferase
VIKAGQEIQMEIFVVDNASVDGSVKMLREKFPNVHCIANTDNIGFSKANNQAIRKSQGEYILLLNPDTVVESDTFIKTIAFMDEHHDAGGLGVKMVDGTGRFLPESKRGLPTPMVAFYKIFGLSKLFPHSRTFNRYHLGYLPGDETNPVDVLAGAFMLLRKSTLGKTGLLDEQFFMYGEDIDLSYRITQAGYKNYYFPETRIIHYKGESTKKGSLNYVFMFYNAMIIFARKHFSRQNARLFSFLINLAIYFRASLSVIYRAAKTMLLPLLDAIITYTGIYLFTRYWEHAVIYPTGGHYPLEFYAYNLPAFILVLILSVFISGGYDKPINLWRIVRGVGAGLIITLVVYALLPLQFRYSRALIIIGSAWGAVNMTGMRLLLHLFRLGGYQLSSSKSHRFAIVGNSEEAHRVSDLLQKAVYKPAFIGLVRAGEINSEKNGFLGDIRQIRDIINIYDIDEIIFCARDLAAEVIIDHMSELQDLDVDYKIAPPESLSIIGSNSINTAGDLYVIDINSISKTGNRRNKRIFDMSSSIILLASWPITAFFTKNPANYLLNLLRVIFGFRSISGYYPTKVRDFKLPKIRKGILNPTDALPASILDEDAIQKLNMLYARDYHIGNEFKLLFRGFMNMGRKS